MSSRKANTRSLSDRDKKILTIVTPILALIIAAILFFTLVPRGQEIADNARAEFAPVALPDQSTDLTFVPEAPENKPDTNDSEFLDVDMRGREIQDEPIELPEREVVGRNGKTSTVPPTTVNNPTAQEMRQVSNIGVRFQVPSIGLNVPYGMVNEVNGIIRPTNFTSAFGIRNRGVNYDATQNGTAYVALHALDFGDGLASGNFFLDQQGNPRFSPGDKVKIGNTSFSITKGERVGKGILTTRDDIWDDSVKNRLIVLICFPSSNDNYLIFAERN